MIRLASTALASAALAVLGGCAARAPAVAPPVAQAPWSDAATDSAALDGQCEEGTPIACRTLAVRFHRSGDEASARRALTLGCLGVSGDACWRWGAAFLRAEGVFADARLARTLFEAGCEGGSLKACRALFGMLMEPVPAIPEEPPREVRLTSRSR